ncbi:MAG TPA: hypothetical protein VGB08_09335 [Allosphingosinicella sp.]
MDAGLLIHVAAGTAALASGAVALAARKGGGLHLKAGTVFFVAMLVMGLTGAAIAAGRPERGTLVIGLFTSYLVATSWVAARRRDGVRGSFELGGFFFALGCAAAMAYMGYAASISPTGLFDSLPAGAHYPFAVLAALAAAFDLAFILRGRLSASQRIGRHLWRMCAAFLIAALSFFLGQQDEFPKAIQGPVWYLPPLAIFAAMIFWIVRIRFAKTLRKAGPLAAALLGRGREAPAKSA